MDHLNHLLKITTLKREIIYKWIIFHSYASLLWPLQIPHSAGGPGVCVLAVLALASSALESRWYSLPQRHQSGSQDLKF
jgi:hypothetical protein